MSANENDKMTLADLSLAELLLLHTNWWLSKKEGARFHLLSEEEFSAIEAELHKRMRLIQFKLQIIKSENLYKQ